MLGHAGWCTRKNKIIFEVYEERLNKTVSQLASAEMAIARLAQLPQLIGPSSDLSSLGLAVASRLINSVSSKSLRLAQKVKKAVMFDITDRQHLEKFRLTIINACDMGHNHGHFVRRRKKIRHKSCPLTLQFPNEKDTRK